jgi:hypothetical protein
VRFPKISSYFKTLTDRDKNRMANIPMKKWIMPLDPLFRIWLLPTVTAYPAWFTFHVRVVSVSKFLTFPWT